MKNPNDFMNQKQAIIEAINYMGSVQNLAKALNVTPSLVYSWIKACENSSVVGLIVPQRAIEVENLTNKAVTRYALRPDIFLEEEMSPIEKLSMSISMAKEALRSFESEYEKGSK